MGQVQSYVTDDRVNLDNLAALLAVLDNAFCNPNRLVEAEMKICTIEQGALLNRELVISQHILQYPSTAITLRAQCGRQK